MLRASDLNIDFPSLLSREHGLHFEHWRRRRVGGRGGGGDHRTVKQQFCHGTREQQCRVKPAREPFL